MERPRRLQHFLLVERLEAGGMGEVFLGRDERSGRLAAIKTLSERLGREEIYVRRFQREARLYRNLLHPNIVSCLDSGFDAGVWFIAMEYLEGRSLARILEVYGRLAPAQALCVIAQLVEALRFAHRQYVIHRDIKPRNIMVTVDGVVKLVDFGVAHAQDQLIQTDAGQMVGTFRYASPEQLQGSRATVRSDLYCVGLVLYEMLSGRRALREAGAGEDPEAPCRDVPPLAKLVPDLDPFVAGLVDRLLAVDPADRPPSAERLALELRGVARDPAILTPLVSVFGDPAREEPRTLGTLATTVSTFLRASLWRSSPGMRKLAAAAAGLWILLSFVFYWWLRGARGTASPSW